MTGKAHDWGSYLITRAQQLNQYFTPSDIRENPQKYGHFTATTAAPGRGVGRTLGMVMQGSSGQHLARIGSSTTKASSMGVLKTQLLHGVGRAVNIGIGLATAGWIGIEAYKQLTAPREEIGGISYIERGARQFGSGYGTGLPLAYYESQKETQPKMAQLEQDVAESMLEQEMELRLQREMIKAAQDQAVYEYKKSIEIDSSQTQKTGDTKLPFSISII